MIPDTSAPPDYLDALRRSEERYRSLVDATAAIVWTASSTGEFVADQSSWSAFTGQSVEQLRGRGWLEAVHPADREQTMRHWAAAVAAGAVYETEHRLRRHDGEYRLMSVRAVPLRDHDGTIREWMGVDTDVTVERRLQQMLDAERFSLREIFKLSPAFIASLDGPEHVFTMANPPYMKLVGESRDILGKSVREALPDLEGQGFFELLDRVYQTGEPFVGQEMKIVLEREGMNEERFVDFLYQPVHGAEGAITGIFAHGNDVTEQVRARRIVERQAEELESANLALLDQIVLNKTITDNAGSCLFMMDDAGRPTFMNPAAEVVTGYTLDEIRDRPLHEAVHHHHPDGRSFPITDCPIDNGREELVPLQDYRDVFVRKDGTFFPVSCFVAPLSGRQRGAVLEFRDITEELRAEEALRAADRRKDEFIATLSHELRTPLTAILGWARILRMGGNDEETIRTAIETINRSAEAQAQLIDDVLDISRITTGKVEIASDVVDVAAVARGALETVRLAAAARAIAITAEFDEHELRVLGDANRLQQVIWNLLSNAIKFTPEGGEVRLSARRRGSTVAVAVTDTGIGIRSDFLPYVFETFRQAESTTTRVHGGLGLGLSIVRYLVELHGGRITAESAGEGAGSTFLVELPRLRASSAAMLNRDIEHSGEVRPGSGAITDLTGIDVLVIDDQADVRHYIGEVLRRGGATMREADSVRAAIDALENQTPDVVLCDIAMPHEDGFAFIRWIQQEARAIPVVAITAFGGETDEARARAAGFADYVRKPIEPSDLSRAVASVAGR